MPTKLRRYALCVRVDEANGTCLMVYENDLNAIEVRSQFPGAQMGKWYRFDLGKGTKRNWEAVEERLPTRIIPWKNARDGGTVRELTQLFLPIFFVPNFKSFACTWRIAPPSALNDKMYFEFVSPRLELPGQINFSPERLAELDIRPGEQCFAFLTLDFQGPETSVKPPQWILEAVEDLQTINVDPLFASVLVPSLPPSVSLGHPKEWGILLDLVIDSVDERNGMGAILCLRDGKLAFGPILKFAGQNGSWRAQMGDTVGFCPIDVDFFNQPVRMALNVLAWHSPILASVDPNVLSDQFPNETLPVLPFVRLTAKSVGKTAQNMFELGFTINDAQMSSLRMGSFRVERLGVLIDMDGELLSAWENMTRKSADPTASLLARVKARLCLTPEQQQPLWMMTEMIEITKMGGGDTERKRQTQDEQKLTRENSETYENRNKFEEGQKEDTAKMVQQQQQQKPFRAKTPKQIKRKTPVPVTNVFMKQNDDRKTTTKTNLVDVK